MGSIDIPPFLRDKMKQNAQTQSGGDSGGTSMPIPDFLKKKADGTSDGTTNSNPSSGVIDTSGKRPAAYPLPDQSYTGNPIDSKVAPADSTPAQTPTLDPNFFEQSRANVLANQPVLQDGISSTPQKQVQPAINKNVAAIQKRQADVAGIEKGLTQKSIAPTPQKPQEPPFNPALFLSQDILGDGSKSADFTIKSADVLKQNSDTGDIVQSIVSNPTNLQQYFSSRQQDIKNQIAVENQKLLDINSQKSQNKGDIGSSVPAMYNPLGINAPDTDADAIHSRIAELLDYQAKLQNAVKTYAMVQSVKNVPNGNAFEIGKNVAKIMGNKAVQDNESKGTIISPQDSFNIEKTGLEAKTNNLNFTYNGNTNDPEYLRQKAALIYDSKNLINKYPEYKSQQLGQIVGNVISKNLSPFEKMSGLWDMETEKQKAIKELGLSKEDAEAINNGDIPKTHNLIVQGVNELGNLAFNVAAPLAKFGTEAISDQFGLGITPDQIGDSLQKVQSGLQLNEPSNDAMQQPATMVDANPNSGTYLQTVQNPNAGKYNFNAYNIGSGIVRGVAGFAGFVGGVKVASGAIGGILPSLTEAQAADAGMTAYMIGSGYNGHYEEAKNIIGDKPEDEWKRNLYALTNGYIDKAVFDVLPVAEIGNTLYGARKEATGEFMDILNNSTFQDIDRDATTKWVQKVLQGSLNAVGETGKIGAAQVLGTTAKQVVNAVLGDPVKANEELKNNYYNELESGLINLPFSMMLPLGVSEFLKTNQHSNFFKQGIYDIGTKPETYTAQLGSLLNDGKIDQDQYNAKVKMVNTMRDIVSSLPDTSPKTGQALNTNQKVEYAYNRLKEIALKVKSETPVVKDDQTLLDSYQNQIKEIQQQKEDILSGGQRTNIFSPNAQSDNVSRETAPAVINPLTEEELAQRQEPITISPKEPSQEPQPAKPSIVLPKTIEKEQQRKIVEIGGENTQQAEEVPQSQPSDEGDLLQKIKDNGKVNPLIAGDDLSQIKSQSLTASPNLKRSLGDENLTTDIIASNSEKDIQDAIETAHENYKNGTGTLPEESLPDHISLLEKGLQKKQDSETNVATEQQNSQNENVPDANLLNVEKTAPEPKVRKNKFVGKNTKRQKLNDLQKIPFDQRTDAQHASYIKQKFAKELTDKGVPKEQIDAATALMDARAKIANKENPDQWYRQIEDVKNGDFTTSDVKYQGGKLKAALLGAATLVHPIDIDKGGKGHFEKNIETVQPENTAKPIKIVDNREGVSDRDKLTSTTNVGDVQEIIDEAKKRNIDPYTALAMVMQETSFEEPDNPFHIRNDQYPDDTTRTEVAQALDLLKSKFELADRLGKKTEAEKLQAWNGYGKLFRTTEGGMKKAYGKEIPAEGLDMNKEPLYGERIIDLRDNVIKKNPEIVKLVDETNKTANVNATEFKKETQLFKTDKRAFVDSVLEKNKNIEWVKRLLNPDAPTVKTNTLPGYEKEPSTEHSTHLMSDDGNGYVFPLLVDKGNGKLSFMNEDAAEEYARKHNTGIQFDTPEQGSWFADNGYKTGHGVLNSIDKNGKPYNDPEAYSELTKTNIKFQDNRGAVETLANGRKVIHALDAPDFTTAIHEIAHIFEDELSPEERKIVTDFSRQKEWNTNTSEAFARGFEQYLKDGKAPTSELKSIFQKAKEWITDIYNKLKQGSVKLTPEVKKVFDNLFKEEEYTEKPADTGSNLQLVKTKIPENDPLSDLKKGIQETLQEGADLNEDTPLKYIIDQAKQAGYKEPQIRQAYNELVRDSGFQGEGNQRELTAPITKSLNESMSKMTGKKGDFFVPVKNDAELRKIVNGDSNVRYSVNLNGKKTEVKSVGADVVNGFYSPIENRISEFKQDKASATKWKEIVGSKEEAKYTGVSDWLNSLRPDQQVSKDDILQHMKVNRIQLLEVVKSKDLSDEKQAAIPKDVSKALRELDYLGFDNASQALSAIRENPGNWKHEWDASSVDDKPHTDIIDEYIKQGIIKFQQYQLPGEKENYKEVLITMPVISKGWKAKEIKNGLYEVRNAEGERSTVFANSESEAIKLAVSEPADNEAFKSSHFDEPNILAHIRINTRTDVEGKKILFLEELQSDFAQKGRREGFNKKYSKDEIAKEYFDKPYNSLSESEKNEVDFELEGRNNGTGGATAKSSGSVPEAPFVTDTNQWTKLGLKYALKHAVEEGADKLAWTTGDQQNERYDLSKQVDEIHYTPDSKDTYLVSAIKDGNPIIIKHNQSIKDIEGLVGKDIATKIQNGEGVDNDPGSEIQMKILKGNDLKVGGKGMKGFYGEPGEGKVGIVGNVAKALVKELTGTEGKIEETKIQSAPNSVDYYSIWNKHTGQSVSGGYSLEEAKNKVAQRPEDWEYKLERKANSIQHSIEITPELKAAVENGQPLFHTPNGEVYGAVKDGKIYLNLEKLNPNTPVHEVGHVWLKWAEQNNSDVYNAGLKIIENTKYLKDVLANKDYKAQALNFGDKDSSGYMKYMKEEALSTAIGDKGAQFITEARRKTFADWAKNLWNNIAKAVGFKDVSAKELSDMSLDEFSSRAARDILAGEPAKGREGTNAEAEPSEPPPDDKERNQSDNMGDWTRVNLKSLTKVRDLFRKVGIGWDKRAETAMKNLQEKSRGNETLYQTATREMNDFYDQLANGKTPRFNTEDQVAMHFLKLATEQQMADLTDLAMKQNSFPDLNSVSADMLKEHYDRINAVLGAMRSESGVGLGYGTVEARLSPDYGLKVRQMDMIRANGGEPLSEEQDKFVKDAWEKEKSLWEQKQKATERIMQEEFDRKLQQLQKEFDDKMGKAGKSDQVADKPDSPQKRERLSKKLEDIAKRIRESNEFDKFLKGDKGDEPTAAGITFDLKEAAAQAIEYVAKAVKTGEQVSDAIREAINRYKGDLDAEGVANFRNTINSLITRASLPSKRDVLDQIKKIAEESGATDITKEMVGKNLIRDFLNSHIGEVDRNEILDQATKELQEILPDTSKDQVTEAFLKKGDFKLPKKVSLDDMVKKEKLALQKIAKKELTADQQQKIKLQEEKEKIRKNIKDLTDKLDNEEYDVEPQSQSVELKKHDAELIKITKEQNQLQALLREEQKRTRNNNKSALERVGDTARSLWVAWLIGSPKTYAKIAWFMVARPMSELVSKSTFGAAFGAAFPDLRSAAKKGGESNSIRSSGKMIAAFFKNMGEEKLQRLYENGEKRYADAAQKYEDYKNSANPSKSKLDSLKRDMNNKMFDSLGNIMYEFIGGSSIKDAVATLWHRANIIEKQFGKVGEDRFSNGNALDKVNYVFGLVGRTHSALKTLSGRASFAGGFMARIEAAVERGEAVDTNKLIEIAHESYLDWERGKYQQSNWISDKWNQIVNSISNSKERKKEWEKYNKGTSFFLRADVAITRVPVNIIHEEVAEYLLGAFRAPIMAAKAYNKAHAQAIEEGYTKGIEVNDGIEHGTTKEEFKNRVSEIVKDMDADQAARIMRCFRKGGMGLGLYVAAVTIGGIQFGIFPHLGQKKKKDEADLAPDELNPGQVMFGKTKLGEITSGMIEHTPALWDMFMGLGIARAYHDDINNGRTTAEAAGRDLVTHLKIIEGNIPQAQKLSPTETLKTVFRSVKKSADTWGLTDGVETQGGLQEGSKTRQFLADENIDVSVPEKYQVKLKVDHDHPYGRFTDAEYDQFKKFRAQALDQELKRIMLFKDRLDKDQLKSKVKAAAAEATKIAKFKTLKHL